MLVPLNRQFDDYSTRVHSVLEIFRHLYGETEQLWYERLMEQSSDLLVFNAHPDNSASGAMPIEIGGTFFTGINVLTAGAKAQVEKRSHDGQRYWREARELIGAARFGQTESGSYLVRVLGHQSSIERTRLDASAAAEARQQQLVAETIAAHDLQQGDLDDWWARLIANDPQTVLQELEDAFNEMRHIGCRWDAR